MNSLNSSTIDLLETSSSSFHFGQLVWAKLASAPFWPAVIFTEENKDWIRHKGKSTHVHVFFFGETAEKSWIQTTRILPFLSPEKFVQQRNKWRRTMKIKGNEEQRLTAKDRSNLNTAIKQTVKLAEFSLRKRINVLKHEWWYWDKEIIPIDPNNDKEIHFQSNFFSNRDEIESDEILQLFNTNKNELDDIICLSDISAENDEIQLNLKHTSTVSFHPLTSNEEEMIIRELITSTDSSFSTSRLVAENEYLLSIQKTSPLTSVISEHWFYLFVFRHCQRLVRLFPRWIDDMKMIIADSSSLPAMHLSQLQSLIILFEHLFNLSNQE